jgi:hypothetical protein
MRVMKIFGVVAAVVLMASAVEAQSRPPSTRGHTATQIGGSFNADGKYDGGKWIDIHYGRPILRGRQGIFESGAEYGQGLLLGAPIWRVGADQTTTFTTEADLLIGGERLAAGEYTMFAELVSPIEWTLVFTTWGVKDDLREENPNALWGAYGYTHEKDVTRTTMSASTSQNSADQLLIAFRNMTQQGGEMIIHWDNQVATVPVEFAY